MPLTKEEYAKGARLVYVNTPECQKMLELLIETDKTWKKLNRAFIRGKIGLEQVQGLHLQFDAAVLQMKNHLGKARISFDPSKKI